MKKIDKWRENFFKNREIMKDSKRQRDTDAAMKILGRRDGPNS